MKSSTKSLRSVIHGLKNNKKNISNLILNTALKTTESSFSVGEGRKKKKFTKIPHFASATGKLCPAAGGGYQKSKEDSYDAILMVEPGQATRMFYVISNDNNEPIMVIGVSGGIVNFSKKAPGTMKPTVPRERKRIIAKAMKELNQMVAGEKLTGEFSVASNGTLETVPVGPYLSENLTKILNERNLNIHDRFKRIFNFFSGTTQGGVSYLNCYADISW